MRPALTARYAYVHCSERDEKILDALKSDIFMWLLSTAQADAAEAVAEAGSPMRLGSKLSQCVATGWTGYFTCLHKPQRTWDPSRPLCLLDTNTAFSTRAVGYVSKATLFLPLVPLHFLPSTLPFPTQHVKLLPGFHLRNAGRQIIQIL